LKITHPRERKKNGENETQHPEFRNFGVERNGIVMVYLKRKKIIDIDI